MVSADVPADQPIAEPDSFQGLIEGIYFERDRHRGVEGTTLWFVEDAQSRWLRAENRRRLWLDLLQDDPQVELTHDGRTNSYRAHVNDDPEAQAYVDELFRAKYGRVDQIRGLLPRDSVPIRLERP